MLVLHKRQLARLTYPILNFLSLCTRAVTMPNNLQAVQCSAGDSAAYERLAPSLDDVVIVSSLRTATCKVRL